MATMMAQVTEYSTAAEPDPLPMARVKWFMNDVYSSTSPQPV